MAEYLDASAPRRKAIIREARFPKRSIVAQYTKAREGLVNFLNDGSRSLNHLARVTEYLTRRQEKADATDWIKRDSKMSAEAIDIFQRSYNKSKFPKIICRQIAGRLPLLQIGPTKISVSLDLTAHKGAARGVNFGGVVLVLAKGESSDRKRIDRCKTIAGLAYAFCQDHLATLGTPDRTLCFAVDVFAGAAHTPQGSFVQKMRQISDSCEEIADRWAKATPPADYDGPDPD